MSDHNKMTIMQFKSFRRNVAPNLFKVLRFTDHGPTFDDMAKQTIDITLAKKMNVLLNQWEEICEYINLRKEEGVNK